jgi:nucleoside-diphosphate-sugar epimerase
MAGPDAEQPLQAVDARDLGAFVASQVDKSAVDTFHVTAPEQPPTFADVFATIASALDSTLPEVRWVGARSELPLSSRAEFWPKMHADIGHARAAGFTSRPLEDSSRDTYDWVSKERAAGTYRPERNVGLTEEQEQELLGG